MLQHNLSPGRADTKPIRETGLKNYSASDGHEISDSKTGICGFLVVMSVLFSCLELHVKKKKRFKKAPFLVLERQGAGSWLANLITFLYEGVSLATVVWLLFV